ncbi:MAG: mechanosensitive ion channel [Phormidesmis sp. RL_2_1]|nr:mechanosensitive ion channel [Phormidesmis sp. RL_2_1]
MGTTLSKISNTEERKKEYAAISASIARSLSIALTLVLISISLNIIKTYSGFHAAVSFGVDLAVTVSLAWTTSRIAQVLIRLYGVKLLGRIGEEVNDLVLIIENIANCLIGFFAVVIFAQTRNFNFLALLTGLGIGAAGIALAAQEALGQVIGTISIYLDRPYIVGEYIRANFNIHAEDVYGRIESIGIRSTKIRIAVSNTLLIVPNSLMSSIDIENISRGTKVMVLLYIDFTQRLDTTSQALASQTIEKSFNGIFGIDPGSTRIHLFNSEDKDGTRARISFFVMGTSESSINLRKRMFEIASESLKKDLYKHKFRFSMEEPTVYVDSPVTL